MYHHLSHLIRAKAEQLGNRTIIKYKDKTSGLYLDLSWANFFARVDEVSLALLALNFTAEDKIGIYSDNKPEWLMADFGIMGIRAISVPFFGSASVSQLQYIIDETQMKLMFVGNAEQLEKACKAREKSSSLQTIVCLDENLKPEISGCFSWKEFCDSGKNKNLENRFHELNQSALSDDLATIIYTSGTTGEPKGVMLTHFNFTETFKIHDSRLDVTPEDVSLAFLPLSHVFERTWSYYVAYKSCVNVMLENPRTVIDEMPKIKPTLMCAVPRFFEKTYEGIVAEVGKWSSAKKGIFNWAIEVGLKYSELKSKALPIPGELAFKQKIGEKVVYSKLRKIFGGRVKFMPCAGAAIRPDLLRFFHACGLNITYGYGATETTATVSCFRDEEYEFGSVGTIMPGVAVKIGDNSEIMVKGNTVFKGYYNKPEETAKSLVDGWYKTGDSGRFTALGNLVMNDRIKDIFKTSGGKYVSPQKIELLLGQDNLIEQVIAIGDNRKCITALIVPSIPNLQQELAKMGIKEESGADLLQNTKVIELFKQRIDTLQEELTPYERVVRFCLLDEAFTIDNSLLTNTLKVKRREVEERYTSVVDAMYQSL